MQTDVLAFTRSEAAEALRVSLRTIDNLLASGALGSRRIGRRIVIPRCELERVLGPGAFAGKNEPRKPTNLDEREEGKVPNQR